MTVHLVLAIYNYYAVRLPFCTPSILIYFRSTHMSGRLPYDIYLYQTVFSL